MPRQKKMYPFRVFISHKVSGHGWAAAAIKQELENYAKEKLKIFISPALKPGVKWQAAVHREIEAADLFILLYLVEGIDMDWCLYEAGYFEREARRKNRKLICVINPEGYPPGPLEGRQRLEATKPDVVKLLKAIYADEHKPVRPDLFQTESAEHLNHLTDFVLNALQPVKREPLSHRCWITLSGDQWFEQLKKGMFVTDAHLAGESEALRQFGIGPGEGISLGDFCGQSEFKRALEYYIPHVTNCLRRIIAGKP
ncbi:MAG: toll/interleukin-1 receptor domain-containing protein, partial [Planctomycetaceae bacterium]